MKRVLISYEKTLVGVMCTKIACLMEKREWGG